MEKTKIRRYDLDWIRVLVFGLLIMYHVGQFFGPWNWHIKNNIIYNDLTIPMSFVNQWRLSSLFLISGMGTAFALSFRSVRKYSKERLSRLGIPFLFGTLVIIAPQVYIERFMYGQFGGSYFDFYPIEFFKGIYPTGNFSWHHLWFLPYLLIFSLVLGPVFVRLRDRPNHRLLRFSRKLIKKKWGLFALMVPLYFTEAMLEPFFPVSHALYNDWFTFVNFLIIFFYGFLFIAIKEDFWPAVDRLKKPSLFIGIITYSLLLFYFWRVEDTIAIHFMEAFVKVLNCYAWMIAIFGYEAVYLNKSSKLLSYCNRAVYPFYIFHQTLIIIFAYFMYDKDWSFWTKFSLLTVATFLGCWILYEIVKRFALGRLLFGIKAKKSAKPPGKSVPGDTHISLKRKRTPQEVAVAFAETG